MSLSSLSSRRRLLVVGAGMALAAAAGRSQEAPRAPREVARIELPGVEGRLDHLAIDVEGQRLFVAALGADRVEVVDLKAGRRVAELAGVREPQGIVFLPAMRRLVVAGGSSNDLVAFDGSGKTMAASGLPDADNLRVFAPTSQIFAGVGSGLVAVDSASLAIGQRITLPGHPEAFELARRGPEIYVNVPTVGRILVVDRRTGRTTAEWPIAPESANFPMALDEAAHRLYVGTRRPARLLVFDTSSGQRVIAAPLCSDVDELFLDAQGGRLFAVCGGDGGEVDVIATQGELAGHRQARLATAPGARTGLLEPVTGTLFVAVPARPGQGAEVRLYRVP